MAIELKDGDYYLGVWTLHAPTRNWMAIIVKRDGKWLIQYRFRYFKDDKVGIDSKDERKFFAFETDGDTPEDQLIGHMQTLLTGLKLAGFGTDEEHVLMRTSDMQLAMSQMNALPSVSSCSLENPGNAEAN